MCKYILSIGSFLFFFLFMLLVSCEHKPAAYDYRSVAVEGWEPGDTLYYHVDTLQVSGIYDFHIGLRTSASTPYPYQSLWIVVQQHWHNPESVICDTINCKLTDAKGDAEGTGVSLYQYDFPWSAKYHEAGSSADVRIYHIMRSEMLPGIADVGIRLMLKN